MCIQRPYDLVSSPWQFTADGGRRVPKVHKGAFEIECRGAGECKFASENSAWAIKRDCSPDVTGTRRPRSSGESSWREVRNQFLCQQFAVGGDRGADWRGVERSDREGHTSCLRSRKFKGGDNGVIEDGEQGNVAGRREMLVLSPQ